MSYREFPSIPRISRRSFLAGSAASVATLLAAGCQVRSGIVRKGLLLGTGVQQDTSGEVVKLMTMANFDANPVRFGAIRLDFTGHGFAPHPFDPNRVAIFEKLGEGACEVNLASKQVVRKIERHPRRMYYGHGAYSGDAKLLYSSEAELGTQKGVVAVRDAESAELLGEFPTFGVAPHDFVVVDDGKTMIVTNGGDPIGGATPSSVTYVDVASEKLIEKIELPDYAAGHLTTSAAGDLAVVSAPRPKPGEEKSQRPGSISLRARGKEFATIAEPAETIEKMLGETLSVAIHDESGVVGATNPGGNLVTFWDMDTGRLIRSFEYEKPKGIGLTLDRKEFVISSGAERYRLSRLSAPDLEPLGDLDPGISLRGGSHVLAHDLEI